MGSFGLRGHLHATFMGADISVRWLELMVHWACTKRGSCSLAREGRASLSDIAMASPDTSCLRAYNAASLSLPRTEDPLQWLTGAFATYPGNDPCISY